MKTLIGAVCLVVSLVLASSAVAQDKKAAPAAKAAVAPAAAAPAAAPAAPAGPPAPSKELEAVMKPFEGSWKCEGKFAEGGMGPGSPAVTAKATVKFKKEMGGFFYKGEYDVKKQKDVPMAFNGQFTMGYEPASKMLIVSQMDNMGGMGHATGKIEGDSVSYTGDTWGMGMKMKFRESMGTKGPKEAWHKFEIDMGKGYQVMLENSCKK